MYGSSNPTQPPSDLCQSGGRAHRRVGQQQLVSRAGALAARGENGLQPAKYVLMWLQDNLPQPAFRTALLCRQPLLCAFKCSFPAIVGQGKGQGCVLSTLDQSLPPTGTMRPACPAHPSHTRRWGPGQQTGTGKWTGQGNGRISQQQGGGGGQRHYAGTDHTKRGGEADTSCFPARFQATSPSRPSRY